MTDPTLYDRDHNIWYEQTIENIKNRDIEAMDWDNLCEEIEDAQRSLQRSLKIYIQEIIEQILKLKYLEPESKQQENMWKARLIDYHFKASDLIEDSPSYRDYLSQEYPKIYQHTVKCMSFLFEIPQNDCTLLEDVLAEKIDLRSSFH